LARILERNYVIFVTEKISSTAIEEMHMMAARDINEALEKTKLYVGRDPRITLIPGGPSIIPILE
jgi:nickel-dependent lactate racemase